MHTHNMSKAGRGSQFEAAIGASLKAYAKAGLALLDFMPVPTAPAGVRSAKGAPLRVFKGKAPFDVYGYTGDGSARFIGAELKDSKRKNRLSIVGEGKKGDGIQFHQISALANVAENGGLARLVWCNGGEVGVLMNRTILRAWRIYLDAYASELSGRTPKKGTKSVAWEEFQPCEVRVVSGTLIEDWLVTL